MTYHDMFLNDSEVQHLKKQLLDHFYRINTNINKIQKSSTEELNYDQLVQSLSDHRGGSLFYKYIGSGMGNGALVELADGSIKYDFISGIGAHFGHNHPVVVEALLESAFDNLVMQGNLQQNKKSAELTAKLIEISGLDHCFMSSSGAIAAENALKLMFQHRHPAKRLLAFENCFIGRTLTLSQISDKPKNRVGLLDNLSVDYLPFYNPNDHQGSIDRMLDKLHMVLNRYPDQYAGMCLELIQGEGGFYPGHQEFFKVLMTQLRQNGIIIYVDEIQSFGRSSEFFTYQHFKLMEYVDIATIGKLSQVCATLFRSKYKPKPSTLSQTFTASSSAIYSSLAIINYLEDHHHFGSNGKNMKLRNYLVNHLEHLEKKYPDHISGPYGEGLMIAFTYRNGSKDQAMTFIKRLYDNGVITFVSGSEPTRIRFLMPIGSVRENDIDCVVNIVEQTVKELMNDA